MPLFPFRSGLDLPLMRLVDKTRTVKENQVQNTQNLKN